MLRGICIMAEKAQHLHGHQFGWFPEEAVFIRIGLMGRTLGFQRRLLVGRLLVYVCMGPMSQCVGMGIVMCMWVCVVLWTAGVFNKGGLLATHCDLRSLPVFILCSLR